MKRYMYSPAVLNSLIPYLTAVEYGRLLCTCVEINTNFDRKLEWANRCPNARHPKQCALIRDTLTRTAPKTLLYEVTSKPKLTVLMDSFRRLLSNVSLINMYWHYMQSNDCPWAWHSMIRWELTQLKFVIGSKIKTRKRKSFSMHQSYNPVLIKRLRLGR